MKSAVWLPWLAPAAALGAAVWLLAPSVAWFDSGELAAAAVQLGVPHPTGFAAWVLGGHATSRIPLANGALRVHLASAIAGVAACWLWLRALDPPSTAADAVASPPLRRWTEPLALLLPWSVPALALHLRAAEVYAPTWLIAAAALWVFQQPERPRLPALALLVGVGAGIHVEAALIALGFLLAALVGDRRGAGPALALLVAGLGAVAYLPLAAQRPAALNWGDPGDWPGLWAHLSAASIRGAFDDQIGASGGWTALRHLVGFHGRWLVLPAAIGAAALVRTHLRALVATALLMAADSVYSAVLNPMGLRDQQAGLLVLLGLAVLAIAGLQAAADLCTRPLSARLALPASVLLQWAVLGALLAGGLGAGAGQGDLAAGGRYADALLAHANPDQLLIASSDHASAACTWLQTAEGARPDCLCLPAAFLRDDRATRHLARQRQRPELLPAVGLPVGGARTSAWLMPFAERGVVAWEPGQPLEDGLIEPGLLADLPWSALLPASAQQRRDQALQLPDAATRACAAITDDPACSPSPTLQIAWSAALAVHAGHWARRDPQVAMVIARAAVRLHRSAKALGNLAALEVEQAPQQALEHCREALQVLPDYQRVHRICARAAVRAELADAALQQTLQALSSLPEPAERRRWLAGLRSEASPALRAVLPEP